MRPLLLVVVLVLAGCVTSPSDPAPIALGIQAVHDFEGEGIQHPITIGAFRWTTAIRYWGAGRLILQYPAKPHIVFYGQGGYVVEPLYPEQRPAIEAAMQRGEFAIVKNGQAVGLGQ